VKVLVVNWQDRENPLSGGAETHLHEIFGRLVARGHEVTLLVSGWDGAPKRVTLDGMDVHRVGSRHTFNVVCPGYYRRHLAERGFDVVVEDLNKVPVFARFWSRSPLVLLVHHLFGTTAFREAAAPFAAATWLLERPIGLVYRGVPTEAVSESTADDLVARGLRREDITVIHNGVDLSVFHPDPAVHRATEPTFLFIGRLKRYKRVDLAVEAVARLKGEGVAARLQIAGRGDEEPRLRALVERMGLEDRVSFEGFVSEERKRDLMRRAWATVLPSPKEGWGITNIEAAACGTPAVVSDSPGLRESVVHGRTGLIVPHADVPALADALRSLAADRAEMERLGRGALEFAAGFTWDASAEQTEAHLEAVIGGARGAPSPSPSPKTAWGRGA
jgi:glycosyltransferase involved in cell wall biosynthesis